MDIFNRHKINYLKNIEYKNIKSLKKLIKTLFHQNYVMGLKIKSIEKLVLKI